MGGSVQTNTEIDSTGPKEQALAALQSVPAAGFDTEKAAAVISCADEVGALEKQLANEVEQLREVIDDE